MCQDHKIELRPVEDISQHYKIGMMISSSKISSIQTAIKKTDKGRVSEVFALKTIKKDQLKHFDLIE